MFAGQEITALDALNITLSSMLIVFIVLFILFAVVKLFPLFFRTKEKGEAKKPEDDEELIAVITAAIRAYEGGQSDPILRSIGECESPKAEIAAPNPMVRDCE